MLTLGLETATHSGGAALLGPDHLHGSIVFTTSKLYSQRLLPSLEWLLDRTGRRMQDVDAIAVSIGPGSFTGLRIGLSSAKSLAYAAGAKLVGVPTMEALALRAAGGQTRAVLVLLDARQGQVYGGHYHVNGEDVTPLREEHAGPLVDLASWLTEPTLVAGDVLQNYSDQLAQVFGANLIKSSPLKALPHPEEVAALGRRRILLGQETNPLTLQPRYVRQSYTQR